MKRLRRINRIILVAMLVLSLGAAFASTADARRQPTKSERKNIKASIEALCTKYTCEVKRIWVSTVNSDYAMIGGVEGGEQGWDISGVVKRTRHKGSKWKWALDQSGGPDTCKNDAKHVPRAVLHDLRVIGTTKEPPYSERC